MMVDVTKTCCACREIKSNDDFHRDSKQRDGRNPMCRPCRADYRRPRERDANIRLNVERRKRYAEDAEYREQIKQTNRLVNYKMTNADFEAIFDTQGRVCAICRTDNPGPKKYWAIDHDHSCCVGPKTCGGCVRGILCTRCNTGLGMLGDSVATLMAARAYLLRPTIQ